MPAKEPEEATYVVREEDLLPVAVFRKALAGISLSGMIYAFLGLVLPVWEHHLRGEYATIGFYFLALNAGVFSAYYPGLRLLLRRRTADVLTGGCALVAFSWLVLGFLLPPVPDWSRLPVLFLLGLGGAITNSALLRAITHIYEHNPAATTNLAAMTFNFGGFAAALLVGAVFYDLPRFTVFVLLAMVPVALALLYHRTRFPKTPTFHQPSLRETLDQFRTPATVLTALVIFFQFGNEYAIAGWLNLYLIQRLGISPKTAIQLTALYWVMLAVGRVLAQLALSRIHHMKVLLGAIVLAMVGCLILITTNNTFGAAAGIIFASLGFSVTLPLLFEKASTPNQAFYPGYFNGILTLAMTGGLLAPFSVGLYAEWFGSGVIMGMPLAGTVIVFILLLALWIESKLAGPQRATSA